ncbi:M48 family metallopeptidase [Belliella kenyensis]|uniref:M48 family metallopeptidase n=1 Tax=Belliella kenyensis TaxID=1472724 RepID=A0ABV8EKW8_9BACT|nr:M48 family metallopeptidase [Belliella kenyensis]MCH7400550.1 M48 family metallopeptidase [Belliella kenyensis]MDN3602163.1 M48 family metallopeptidase [Belliella kenyensis]
MDAIQVKYLLIGIVIFGFLFDKTLSFLNTYRKTTKIPDTLEQYIDKKKLEESDYYQKSYFKFGLLTSLVSTSITIVLIYFGIFGALDNWLSGIINQPILQSIIFFGIIFIGSDILSIPFDYYQIFHIEEKFGFNKTSASTFFIDKIKGYLLSIMVGGGLLAVLLWLIHQMGMNFWWQFWLIAGIFMILINLFYTSLILPLFNKLTPLPQSELREKIMAYARKVDFPLDNLFVIDGSKRSSKANAFFSGIGKRKKVVLYDTLIDQHTPDELVAVLAHEIGHYKKKHIIKSMISSILQIGLLLFILAQFINSSIISNALGGEGISIHLNIIGFTMLFSPISMIIGIFMNMISRKNEFEADAYAKETYDGRPLAEALKTLSVNSLSKINPHPWYVFVNYSHPPLMQRLERLEKN